eukprot:CAMPEP_0171632298 /NCGR_PEP_ID=MMETSP0990-20121206/24313_1 /TAXON_ID=483369 /ORGANISM="non described non described, Strain CCMP2098" /LENGTH=39 /DNA_ID= /DNA_START= /DNA_END= /DNA_ORIENTATION=
MPPRSQLQDQNGDRRLAADPAVARVLQQSGHPPRMESLL